LKGREKKKGGIALSHQSPTEEGKRRERSRRNRDNRKPTEKRKKAAHQNAPLGEEGERGRKKGQADVTPES